MAKENYDKIMRAACEYAGPKKRLLLHCCCAPCSTACLNRLKDFFKITVLFYNPNIEREEYLRRKEELLKFIARTGWADVMDCDHEEEKFYAAVKGFEGCKEGGERCKKCFELRLAKAAKLAKEGGFDYFTTTLTVSPLKDAEVINAIGKKLGGERWLCSDFKKRDGYLESCRLSKEYGLYRQNYCGCVFSRRDAPNA